MSLEADEQDPPREEFLCGWRDPCPSLYHRDCQEIGLVNDLWKTEETQLNVDQRCQHCQQEDTSKRSQTYGSGIQGSKFTPIKLPQSYSAQDPKPVTCFMLYLKKRGNA